MTTAFVDTSILVALAYDEPSAHDAAARLAGHDLLFASTLLEAELASACRRERRVLDPRLLESLQWVAPPHRLSAEVGRVMGAGFVRGADCFHLATALYLSPNAASLTFLTLDQRQREVALALGFRL